MTIKEKLESEILRLEEVKAGLLRKEQFLNPSNSSFIYSSESIGDIKSTQGTTPNNLSTILETVVKTINEYVDYIRTIPFAESNVIYRERPDVDMALVSNNRHGFFSPMDWTLIAENNDFASVYSQVALTKYYGSIKSIQITASPSFRKHGESGNEIDFEMKMIRVNPRRSDTSVFRSGSGPLSIALSEDAIFPDDVFMIGIVPNVNIDSSVVYYKDFSYKMTITRHDGSEETTVRTTGNSRIGNSSIDSDTSAGMMISWDLIAVNKLDISLSNTLGNTTVVVNDNDGPILGGLSDGNIVSSISVGQFSMDLLSHNISYRENISWYRQLADDRFSLYNMNTSEIQSIVFNNVRPIDRILEEALNAL